MGVKKVIQTISNNIMNIVITKSTCDLHNGYDFFTQQIAC